MYWIQHLEQGPKRVNHASVVVRGIIYSFGGYCSEENMPMHLDVHVFDAASLEWHSVPYHDVNNAPNGLYGHSVVAYGYLIYLWGGLNSYNRGSNKLYCFDTLTFRWSIPETTGTVPKSTDGHSACVIGDYMYIFGGFEEYSESLVNTLHRVNLVNFQWEDVWTFGSTPKERDFHSASVIGDRIYIFGGRGFSPNGSEIEIYDNSLVYLDTIRKSWVTPETFGEPPCGRRSHSAVVYNGEIYIIGGCSPNNSIQLKHLNDIHKFNPETGVWTRLNVKGHGPCPRRRHCSVVLEDHLYLFGGSSPTKPEDSQPQALETGMHFLNEPPDSTPQLKEHSDMYILDFFPNLKRLCQLKMIECKFVLSSLPYLLQEEIRVLTQSHAFITEHQLPIT